MEDFEFYEEWSGGIPDDILKEFKGPALDGLQAQSEYAPAVLTVFKNLIKTDQDYVQRLIRHYAYFKNKLGMRLPRELRRVIKPSEACPCRSGQIFRLCCGKK